jgi:hypothetical protein
LDEHFHKLVLHHLLSDNYNPVILKCRWKWLRKRSGFQTEYFFLLLKIGWKNLLFEKKFLIASEFWGRYRQVNTNGQAVQ